MTIKTYEQAARKPIDTAAELLHFNIDEYAKYNYTQQYTEYFKDNSYIDLFYLNGAIKLDIETKFNSSNIPDYIYNPLVKIYLEERSPYNIELSSKEEIINWNLEQFLPKIIYDFNLSPYEIHFLERIGDYVNRGDHILDKTYNYRVSSKVSEKYVELIVRSMELKASNIEIDNCFKELDNFHSMFVSPYINKEIHDAYAQKYALYLELTNNNFIDTSGNLTQPYE